VFLSLPTDNTLVLEQACHRLLTACTGWLKAQHRGLEALRLNLCHGYKEKQTVDIRLSEATDDQKRLERLVFERLRQTLLVAEVHSISLDVDDTQALAGKSQTLFQGSQDLQGPPETREKLQALTERLQSRLGPESILGIALCNSHQPEAAMTLTPWQPLRRSKKAIQRTRHATAQRISSEASPPPGPSAREAPEPNTEPAPGLPGMAPRPTWLLPEPLALTVRRHQPQYHGPLRLRAGPERLEFGWWATPIQRDYFVAETTDHRLVWVFRSPSHQWFLHGFFG
jgi:protein ImuB